MIRLYVYLAVIAVFVRYSCTEISNDTDNGIIEVFNQCKCVKYIQCDENNFIITDGTNLLTPRIKDEDRIKCKGGKFDGEIVCCKERPDIDINPKNPDDSSEEPEKKKIACGKQKTMINVRIFGTDDNELVPVAGEFPWLAAVFHKTDDEYTFELSGSLIHPKVILTANHNVVKKKAENLKVIVNGQIELPVIGNNTSEERNVIEIVRHEEFNSGSLYNDVALLILDKPYIEGKNFLNRICLPPKDVKMEGLRCLVAGWGKEAKETAGPKILKKVEVPFVQHRTCQDLLRRTRLGSRFKLHKTFVCAGGEKGKDACKGDGGSPLMCPLSLNDQRYFQAGIVAWGIGCGTANVPGVYGNVKAFKTWIKNELEKRGLHED